MIQRKKLSPEDSKKIIDSLGGNTIVVGLLDGAYTLSAVSFWKRHGMLAMTAGFLKMKTLRHPVWKEIKI